MWTQDGHHKMASRGGQLGTIKCAGEGTWGDHACRGGQLGANRLAGEELGINQASRGVVRGDQAGRQKWLGAISKAGR